MYDQEKSHFAHAGQSIGLASEAGRRMPELPAAIDRQERVISDAGDALAQLEARLNPVLRGESPAAPGGGLNQARPSPATQAAGRVEENTDRITSLQRGLRGLLDRLEV